MAGARPRRRDFLLFLGFTTIVGLVMGGPFLIGPVRETIAARSWAPATCEIRRSTVHHYTTAKNYSMYEFLVDYRYYVDGHEYFGHRYQFYENGIDSYEEQSDLAHRLAVGTKTPCWVDPKLPVNSVIERGLTSNFLSGLWNLSPLLFVAVGLYFVLARKGWFRPPDSEPAAG